MTLLQLWLFSLASKVLLDAAVVTNSTGKK
jgi:hypothetical protein